MKSPHLVLAILALSAWPVLFAPWSGSTSAQVNGSLEWEYKVVDVREAAKGVDPATDDANGRFKQALESFLNENGRGGWELVSYSGLMAIYKREAAK